ncbi:MAG: hypothetical protein WAQ24_05425 [Candidatus Saccharimonadales bacterium]
MHTFVLNSQEYDGHHEVHDVETHCASRTFPEPGNQINLGEHPGCVTAIAKAELLYPSWDIDGCYYCTECHTK